MVSPRESAQSEKLRAAHQRDIWRWPDFEEQSGDIPLTIGGGRNLYRQTIDPRRKNAVIADKPLIQVARDCGWV